MKIRQPEQPVGGFHHVRWPMWAAGLPRGAWLAFLALVASWTIASTLRVVVDYPLVRALNVFAGVSAPVDRALGWVTTYYLLTGVLFMALVWGCWFASDEAEQRGRVLMGTIAACLAGMASRVLQLALPTHLRPLHDPALGMTLPAGVDPAGLNHWSSFPSDHAAVQFGLACVVWLVRPALGRLAFAWALAINVARVYLGAHFPTDIAGGAALGVLAVLLAQTELARRTGRALQAWARRAPFAFYGLAFFISYQIATLFDEARTAGVAVLAVLRGMLPPGAM